MIFFWTMFVLSLFPSFGRQEKADERPSKDVFVIAVDPFMKGGDLQVIYFLAGEFGGFGGFEVSQDGKGHVLIPTTVEGKAAKSLKVVLYAPHCRIQTIRVDDLQASDREEAFHCIPAGEIQLRGRFDRGEIGPDRKLEVEIRYLGFWGHAFFGIADGPVLTLRVGKALIERDGSFHTALPNFREGADPVTQSDEDWFELVVLDSETGNIVAELEPPAALSRYGHLKMVASDPGEVEFRAKWRE